MIILSVAFIFIPFSLSPYFKKASFGIFQLITGTSKKWGFETKLDNSIVKYMWGYLPFFFQKNNCLTLSMSQTIEVFWVFSSSLKFVMTEIQSFFLKFGTQMLWTWKKCSTVAVSISYTLKAVLSITFHPFQKAVVKKRLELSREAFNSLLQKNVKKVY